MLLFDRSCGKMDEKICLMIILTGITPLKGKKFFSFVMNTKLSISNELSPLIIES
jgi:hypothetical protein